MEKPWLRHYHRGVPEEIDVTTYSSLVDLAEKSFAKYRDLPAYTCMGKTLTYGELDTKSRDLAAYFTACLGLRKGDRVALMMPNTLQYPIALYGALRAGLIVVNVNPLYTARELEHQLNDSGAEAIVIVENFAHVLEQVIARTRLKKVILTRLGDFLGAPKSWLVNFVVKNVKKMVPPFKLAGSINMLTALAEGHGKEFKAPTVTHDDLAFLQYTGGTTGVSKGAMLTHRNMIANLEQAYAWLKNFMTDGQEIVITALPLYHIFSLTANCLTFMKIGGHNILITNPRDIPGFVKELAKYRFTAITGVNTLFNALMHCPDFAKLDFSSLKLTLGGGMAVQKAVADKWKKATGKPLIQAYGLTETSPAACINPLDVVDFTGSIGIPIPSTAVSIRSEDNQELPHGQAGELCIKGPQVMKGYWQRPDETSKVFSSDGWLKTGDIAVMDEKGFVTIVDRKKDMIIVSGFNVYPNEIEDIVAAHPGVLEVAAIGVEAERSGEVVKVYVVRKDPSLTGEELIAYCKQHLTGYKVPKLVEFRTELPKTNVGKILRRALREEKVPAE